MRMKYVGQIQSNLRKRKTINTNRLSSALLDGSYVSVYKGKSMNFDELRDYVSGDEIKDVDWKASARNNKLLVRQYVAERKHNIMLVMDTNRRMIAHTDEGEEKSHVATIAAGTLAFLVNQNGDYISAVNHNGKSVLHSPFRTGLINIELLLEAYNHCVGMDNNSQIENTLDYIVRNYRRRMIIVVVTDLNGATSISETTLKRLMVLHDVLVIQVGDTTIGGKKVFDVEDGKYLPEYITGDNRLIKREKKIIDKMKEVCQDKFKKFGIPSIEMQNSNDMDLKIVELLNKHRGEKKHGHKR